MDIAHRRRHRFELGRRQIVRPRLLAWLLVTALAGCTSGDGGGIEVSAAPRPEGDRAYGDTLIRALAANVSGLIPNITGDKYSHDAVARLLTRLSVIPDLEQVQLVTSEQAKLANRKIIHFKVGADIRPPGGGA